MTHLPSRSWCAVCIKAKSKSDQRRRLKLKKPVIHIDFAFWVDSNGISLPIRTAVDVLCTMSSASAPPSKEFNNYAVTELKRFIYEVGRTYGHLQSDQYNSIIAIAKAAIRDIGCLQFRMPSK